MIEINTEQEQVEMQKKIRKWQRWKKKQPEGGGLPFDTWLRESPKANAIVKHAPSGKPDPRQPNPPDIDGRM